MADDNIEFDIVVNGKEAKTTIKEVEKAQDNLATNTKKTTSTMSANWSQYGTRIAAVAATMAIAAKASLDFERASFGLTEQTKEYIKQASLQHGINEGIVADFVQTGKSAGLAGKEISNMVDMAVALGRKYPHESTETFIDNLAMLNSTGEAQGFIVDVLEQKYGAIDLKTLSLSQKMEALEEATDGVNKEFSKTNASKFDRFLQEARLSVIDIGDTLIDIADESGALWLFNKGVNLVSVALKGWSLIAKGATIGIKKIFGQSVTNDIINFKQELKDADRTYLEFVGKIKNKGVSITAPDIKGRRRPKEQKDIEDEAKKSTEKIAKTSLSSWRMFYEKIGQLDDAWLIKKQELRKQYVDLNEEQFKEILEISKTEYFEKFGTLMDNQLEDVKDLTDSIGDYFQDTFADKFADSLTSGKASFKDFADSILKDIARIIAKQTIAKPMGNAIGGLISGLFSSASGGSEIGGVSSLGSFNLATRQAKGGVSGTRLAQGGVVSSATKMRFAQGGTALVGERNKSEGVLPLARTSNGDLGVQASIGGSGGDVINSTANIFIQAIDTQNGTEFLIKNKDTVKSVIVESIISGSEVNKAIRQTSG